MKNTMVFFYTEDGSTENRGTHDILTRSENRFIKVLKTDSYLYLLEKLYENKVVDSIRIIIVSNREPGFTYIGKYNFPVYVVPNIWDSECLINKNDILFYRGGFRSWHDFIVRKKEQSFFNMLYAANTGRERWKFWDLILEDLDTEKQRSDKYNRIWFPFSKPVNQDIFKPLFNVKKKYDICIGASHIHDKKGQWRVINAIIQNQYLKKLKYVMPGSKRRGTKTNEMYEIVKKYRLNIEFPGMLDRNKLAKVYNQSRLFVYGGEGGQNDRSLLESLACGTDILFIKPNRHAHFLKSYYYTSNLTIGILFKLHKARSRSKEWVVDRYNMSNGLNRTIDQFRRIIKIKLDKDKGVM